MVSWSTARGGQCSGWGRRRAPPGPPPSPARGSPARCGRPGKDPADCSSAASRRRTRGTRGSCSPVSWCSAGARSHSARRGAARSAQRERRGRAGPGPALIQGAGLLTVAAGLLRRDHMLLNAPGEPGASWHSNAHDAISGLVYVNLVVAQLALARRFGRDPPGGTGAHGCWPAPRPASSSSRTPPTWTGPAAAILQRVAVTLPQAAAAAIAARLMWRAWLGQEGSDG